MFGLLKKSRQGVDNTPLVHIGKRPTSSPLRENAPKRAPDWRQADPRFIRRALERAQGRPTGGWYVLGRSDRCPDGLSPASGLERTPARYTVNEKELVAWRHQGKILVAEAACPHMGADLSCGHVKEGLIVCPWHGLALGPEGHGRWQPLPTYDDGVLLWVRLPEPGQEPTEQPILSDRPAHYLAAVVSMEARCEPEDIVANRLDPWHGAHYHPHSFAALKVLEQTDDVLTLRVSFRVFRRLAVEVDCTFHSPEPRTITMTIIEGEGTGSVVETHATPLGPGRSQMIEATLATSNRLPERWGKHWISPFTTLTQQLMERRAARLWVEDVAYAERRYAVRSRAAR